MARPMGCLFLVLIIAPVFAADEDGRRTVFQTVHAPGTVWKTVLRRQPAPEFADITAWINSPPLKMSDLRGKVVVVHFMAFG